MNILKEILSFILELVFKSLLEKLLKNCIIRFSKKIKSKGIKQEVDSGQNIIIIKECKISKIKQILKS